MLTLIVLQGGNAGLSLTDGLAFGEIARTLRVFPSREMCCCYGCQDCTCKQFELFDFLDWTHAHHVPRLLGFALVSIWHAAQLAVHGS